jgi:transglutaminase-like putative cysteine protease
MKGYLKTASRNWRRFILLSSALLILVLVLPSCQTADSKYSSSETLIPKQKEGEITFNLSITPETGKDVKLWLPYPTSNEYQLVENVNIDGNYDNAGVYREPESDSILLFAEWLQPTEDATIIYSFDVTRQEIIRKDFQDNENSIPVEIEKYLESTSLGPTIGNVKETAIEITKGKDNILEKATAIYDWIVENFQRDPGIIGCGVGDVELLLQTQAGKCTDISSVFVALARSAGVPAREIFGIRIGKEGDITTAFHCRGEFYLPGYGWVPVDPSDVRKFMLNYDCGLENPDVIDIRDYYFGAQNETYIDFYSGRDVTLNPMQAGGPLNYLMYPYAEVGGELLDWFAQEDLQYTVTFKEF